MKIAICFSGQIRTGVIASENIKHFIGDLDVDYFIHSWDVDQYPPVMGDLRIAPSYTWSTPVLLKTFVELKQIYNFKKIEIEICNNQSKYPLWYSWYKSIQLKKEYEEEYNIKYDVVIKMRSDIIFDPFIKLTDYIDIKQNTLYVDNLWVHDGKICSSDVFFLSSSDVMDVASEFYVDIAQNASEYPHMLFPHYLNTRQINTEKINELFNTIYRNTFTLFDPIKDFYICSDLNKMMYYEIEHNETCVPQDILNSFIEKLHREIGFIPTNFKNLSNE